MPTPDPEPTTTAAPRPPRRLGEVLVVMLKLGTIAFGGPAVHVAMLREETVRRRHWLTDAEFLDLFGAVSVLPGPSSTQLAIVLGRRRAGWAGLLLGGACFILPAMAIVLALAWAYVRYGSTPTGGGVLYGVGPVVIAVVAVAVWELARSALMPHREQGWLAVAGLAAVGVAALAGYLAGLNVLVILAAGGVVVSLAGNWRRLRPTARALLPAVPVGLLAAAVPVRRQPSLTAIAVEFLKLGVVVFGSGYVLLAFLQRDLVSRLGWLDTRQVLDAVVAGQITPGPVFTTATFLGYLLGGVPGAVVATAGIFLPSFVMVAALEPLIGRIRRSPWASAALDGITIAALGLMAGVTIDLGRAAVTDPLTAAVALVALLVVLRWRPNTLWLVLAGAAIGIARTLA
ncbi:MAG TPA: chromate efflux transporter [Actinomycetes bacterium]|jgi:chromate transporter|nr:chromate efflux transporter [Actinomycetes bacterium]